MRSVDTPAHQRGTTLLEALVVMTLFAMGLVSLARMQTGTGANTDEARQNGEAMRLAQQKLDELRGFEQLHVESGRSSFDALVVSSTAAESIALAGAPVFSRSWTVHDGTSPHYKTVVVAIQWLGRQGTETFRLPTVIARHPPDAVWTLGIPTQQASERTTFPSTR